METAERQVAPTRDGIRRDHVARYEWAARMIAPGNTVLDVGCGIGYGAQILAERGAQVRAIDVDEEAIDYALKHFAHNRLVHVVADVASAVNIDIVGRLGPADVAVCFEILEHLEDPRPLLEALGACAPRLLVSVPNEAALPFTGQAHHHRHYTADELGELLLECGWTATWWCGQRAEESEVEGLAPDGRQRTILAICKRTSEVMAAMRIEPGDAPEAAPEGVPERRPLEGKHIALVGMGPSANQYLEQAKRAGGRRRYCDETWGINAMGDVYACDRVFHMDDVRIQEIRAAARPQSNIAAMLQWMRGSTIPIVTSRAHPDYPSLEEFPLEAVINDLGFAYFNSTAAYAVAYAVHKGAAKLSIFGFDFTYPNAYDAEKGRACVEFWLGIAHGRGVKIAIPQVSSLMDSCHLQPDRLYGYDTVDVTLSPLDGRVAVELTERAGPLPSADDIEARYDHSAHPNPLVERAPQKD